MRELTQAAQASKAIKAELKKRISGREIQRKIIKLFNGG